MGEGECHNHRSLVFPFRMFCQHAIYSVLVAPNYVWPSKGCVVSNLLLKFSQGEVLQRDMKSMLSLSDWAPPIWLAIHQTWFIIVTESAFTILIKKKCLWNIMLIIFWVNVIKTDTYHMPFKVKFGVYLIFLIYQQLK